MSTVYYVSTPRFTCKVVVDGRGIITPATARYLHRWYGGRWDTLQRRLHADWGQRAVRVVALDSRGSDRSTGPVGLAVEAQD